MARFPQDRLGDPELVESVAAGDHAALGVVWDRYSGLVRNVLRGTLGADSAAEDLLQEVFLAFYRGAIHIQKSAALRAYLVGVAVRLAALELRRRRVRRWVTLSPTGMLPELPIPPHDTENRERLRSLYRVLDRLSTRRRLAFVLRHVEGLSLIETAQALRVSESTAKREVTKAREQVLIWASREPSLVEYLSRISEGSWT